MYNVLLSQKRAKINEKKKKSEITMVINQIIQVYINSNVKKIFFIEYTFFKCITVIFD